MRHPSSVRLLNRRTPWLRPARWRLRQRRRQPAAAKRRDPWLSADWKDEPGEYGDIARLVGFFTTKGVQYWRLTSANAISASNRVYVLGDAGQEYVAYSALGRSLTLNLRVGSAGSYRLTWYNPATGAYTAANSVSGGTAQTLTPPFSGDAVLHLLSR